MLLTETTPEQRQWRAENFQWCWYCKEHTTDYRATDVSRGKPGIYLRCAWCDNRKKGAKL